MLDWLSTLSIRWVLVLVGALLVARVLVLRADFVSRNLRHVAAEVAETFAVAMVMVFLVLHRFVFQLFFIPSESMVPTLLIHDRILVNRFVYFVQPPQRRDIIVFHAPKAASSEPKDFVKRLIGLPGESVAVTPDEVLIDGRPRLPIVNQDEPNQPASALRVPVESRVETDGARLLVNGECFLAVSPTGRAEISGRDLLINGVRVYTFASDDPPRPTALPASFHAAARGMGMAFYEADGRPFFVVQGQRLQVQPGHVDINGKPLAGESYVAQTPRYRLPPKHLGKDEYFVMGDNRNVSLDSHRWGALKGSAIVGKAWAMFWPLSRMGLVH